jgi:hypothetical protein
MEEENFLVQYGRFLPGLVRRAVRASKPLVRSSVRLCDNPESLCGVRTICARVRRLVRASGHSVRPSDDLCARKLTCARRRRLVRNFGTEIISVFRRRHLGLAACSGNLGSGLSHAAPALAPATVLFGEGPPCPRTFSRNR